MRKNLIVLNIFVVILLSTLAFTYIGGKNHSKHEINDEKININNSSEDPLVFTGAYQGNVSVLGLNQVINSTYWLDSKETTVLINHNESFDPYPYEYHLNRLDIRAYNMLNGSGTYNISDDLSIKSEIRPAVGIAQEFESPDDIALETLSLWCDFSAMGIGAILKLRASIFDENLIEEIDFDEITYMPFGIGWVDFDFYSNILEANETYNIVLTQWQEGGYFVHETETEIKFWDAVNHSSPAENKGLSRTYDNNLGWNPIINDTYRDMILNFSYYRVIDPIDIDLKFIVENATITPAYQKNLRVDEWGYEAFYTYNLNDIPTREVNVTVVTNTTIPTLNISIKEYYIHLLNVKGSFSASGNQILWTIIYPYKEIGGMWPSPFFLFEYDWNFISLHDPDGIEMVDLYFGPMKVFNVSYFGIFQLFGLPLELGNFTGTFSSPSYCNTINTQVQEDGGYQKETSIELGQTIKIEAEIVNNMNEPISGGTGQIILTSPSGRIIYSESGLSSINGILSSSEIEIEEDFEEGTYEALILWTNGIEVAYFSIQISVASPENLLPLIILMSVLIILAIAATPLYIMARKLIKQRNWERSLRSLFVLSHEGLSMYDYTFGIELQDPTLISGMILALSDFIKEATGSKEKLRIVDHEDKKIILNHGTYCMFALLADKDLPIIHKRLEKFAQTFEAFYGKKLKAWKGQTALFKGAESIVSECFPIDVEHQIIRGIQQKLLEFKERISTIEDPNDILPLKKELTDFYNRYGALINKYFPKEFEELND